MVRHSSLPIAALLAIATLLGACGGAEPEPGPPKVQVVTGHAKAPEGAFERLAFQCCDTPEAAAVVGAFSDLGAALAADDTAASTAGAGRLAEALTTQSALLTGEAAPLAELPAALRAADSIDAVRAAYLTASVPMLAFARAHTGGTGSYAVAYCSMKPGRWLQSATELANPYYGAQMLRCGTFEALK